MSPISNSAAATTTPAITRIMLNVQGSNRDTGKTKSVVARFSSPAGDLIDGAGTVIEKGVLKLVTGVAAPSFDNEAYKAALAAGKGEAAAAMIMAFADQHDTIKQQGGGTEDLVAARECLRYCYEREGFLPEDGDGFVLKIENIDTNFVPLGEAGGLLTVTGTAVFGR